MTKNFRGGSPFEPGQWAYGKAHHTRRLHTYGWVAYNVGKTVYMRQRKFWSGDDDKFEALMPAVAAALFWPIYVPISCGMKRLP